jgi:hypothetical protein
VASEPEDFVVFLPDSPSTDRVFNGGALLHAPGFSLFFRRWTRVAHGQVAALPTFVHVELWGIPAHAWSKSTAQQLLGLACWVQAVHSATEAHQELRAFHLSAWCRQPDKIPPVVDLFIPEPTMVAPDQSAKKPGFTFPVRIRVLETIQADGSPPPSPPAGLDQGRRCRRHRR